MERLCRAKEEEGGGNTEMIDWDKDVRRGRRTKKERQGLLAVREGEVEATLRESHSRVKPSGLVGAAFSAA